MLKIILTTYPHDTRSLKGLIGKLLRTKIVQKIERTNYVKEYKMLSSGSISNTNVKNLLLYCEERDVIKVCETYKKLSGGDKKDIKFYIVGEELHV